MMNINVEAIADEILSKLSKPMVNQALDLEKDDRRCGQMALLLRDAVTKCNLAMYRGIEYWWNPELGYWCALGNGEMKSVCQNVIARVGLSPADIFKREPRMIQMMRDNICFKQLSPKKSVITFSNVTLDVDTGIAVPKSSEFHTIFGLDYRYDPEQRCDKWLRFLYEVMPDPELRCVFQEYLGIIFIDRQKVKLEKILYLLGGGSNGKGVIFETINRLLGVENITNYDLSSLAAMSNEYTIANVDGKMLNYCSDADKVACSGAKIKNVISGEPVPARLPYGQPFTAYNIPVLMVNANEMPARNDHTHGANRRLIIIPMNVTIPDDKQNHMLHIELAEERSGILNWIFEGRSRFIAQNYRFSKSKAADYKLREYEIESNSALLFLQENRMHYKPFYVGQSLERETAVEIYRRYKNWCDISGMKPFSQKIFGSKMREKNYPTGRYGSGVYYAYYTVPTIEEYEKKIISGMGLIDMQEYQVISGGRYENQNLIDSVIEKEVEPISEMRHNVELNLFSEPELKMEDDDEIP